MKNKVQIVILVGIMYAGKGSFLKALKKSIREIAHFCSGNIVRDHIKRQTPLGQIIAGDVSSGGYVHCETISALCIKELSEILLETDILVMDGYPRTIDQANHFMDFLERNSAKSDYELTLVHITTSSQVCRNRAKEADKSEDRSDRPDTAITAFEERLRQDMHHIPAVIDYFLGKGAHPFYFDGEHMWDNAESYGDQLIVHLGLATKP